ncbi:hypothetical protein ROTO_07680 [Roseovarius tolerans]|uniref:Uncharacterized protein n=1 Tax=Roseovarius tolerans TaxID=74031 RepID=A0A0L6CY73_9RHOB|nr:hypothetical protein [Roseovarius tolerans]KNX42699.1 hypothetical protein ROTO_07680 [Roseovarius tolerans]SEM99663.1 hypothetical protein SAMN04488077_110140 [Roseovarius tolerans]
MKARWLKSVVKHSKDAAPALPYARGTRQTARRARMAHPPKAVKSA